MPALHYYNVIVLLALAPLLSAVSDYYCIAMTLRSVTAIISILTAVDEWLYGISRIGYTIC